MPAGRPRGTPKTGGRKPGAPNKVTTSVKEALVQAFDKLGGVPALVKWGRENPTEFYKIWTKILPAQAIGIESESGGIKVIIRSVLDKGE